MMRRWILAGCLGALVAAGCGGGSGSTGLITSEGEVIDHVRETGSCDEFEGAPYCATDSPDATAPGGQSVSIVGPTPTAVTTPTAHLPTETPTPEPTAVPTTEPTEEPIPSGTPTAGGPVGTPTPGSGSSSTPGSETPDRTATPVRTKTATPIRTKTPTPVRTVMPTPLRTGTKAPASPTPTAGGPASVTAAVSGFDDGAACATAARTLGSEDRWQTAALVPIDASGRAVTFPLPTGVTAPRDAVLLCFAEAPDDLPEDLGTLTEADPTVVFVLPSF